MAKAATPKKQCFVVGPIGDDDSDDRIHADWLLEEIIEPVFAEHFPYFEVTRADKISNPGRIDAQVITALLESELVIADLTTLNPNAFYEIGIRHMIQKPIIHMHLEGQRIPFDIASFRSIKFQRRRPKDLKVARDILKSFADAALAGDHEVDNPVTFSRGKVKITEGAASTESVFMEELSSLHERLARIETDWLVPGRRRTVTESYTIRAKNTAPDRDVQTAVRSWIRNIEGAELFAMSRTEARLRLPATPQNPAILAALLEHIGEDFVISPDSPNIFS
ncbi:hypothetical protein JNB71_22590 [Rhizobium herbae]|uniref:CD-NTase-associated protein 12/Pycsar effector protein TIR domain-containing protein n=1 Tax=Rhizobium herbae TaxID=508661 RepID=A0ABS7HG54_9HYPH|nr:hypothetical protein [Rhizobium herbae]MBW9066100.1 hypothetical protein [Rhizobium herbae]